MTVSDAEQGARLVVYAESGEQIAASTAIGQGNRWRHQIAAGPFGPNGEMELVDVLTPHLGRVVEFFRLDGDELKVVARLEGYTSHVLGSHNLDQAAGGDFDSDGLLEVLLMTPDLTELAAVQHTTAGAMVIWTVPAGGIVTTNLGTAGTVQWTDGGWHWNRPANFKIMAAVTAEKLLFGGGTIERQVIRF